MAEKKPSKYTDRGTIGSAEELDAYGVWVKSEPQDLTTGMADAVNFDTDAVPYADFDMDFDAPEESNYDFADLESAIPEIDPEIDEDDNTAHFNNGVTTATVERSGEEESTRLLMKIADELSAIRSELSTLKKEFAGVRIENVPAVKTEARHGGFFDGEEGDDEKITLTGDEMKNILTSADFSEEEDFSFDAQREADEAALKELSEQNESIDETEEEIKIDFDNLGIKLDDDAGAEAETESHDDFPPLEAGIDDDFETSSFDTLSSEEIPEEELMSLEPLEPLEDDEELQDLRREGAVPFTPAPDNSGYLETDPFALDDVGEDTFTKETVSPDTASEITTDLNFDDASFDLHVDDFPAENLSPPTEETVEQQTDVGSSDFSAEIPISFEDEISLEEAVDTPVPLEDEITLEEAEETPTSLEDEITLEEPEETPASLEDEITLEEAEETPVPLEDEITLEEPEETPASLEDEIALEEPEETPVPLEDEITLEEPAESPASLEDEITLEEAAETPVLLEDEITLEEPAETPVLLEDEITLEEPAESPASLEDEITLEETEESPASLEDEITLEEAEESPASLEDEITLEEAAETPASLEDEITLEEAEESPASLEDEITLEEPAETPTPLENKMSDEQLFMGDSLDLSDAVIDEPDLSAGIVEAPLEEPVLGDISFGDDVSLDMDDFGVGIDIDTKDSGLADDPVADSLAIDIDTSAELGAEENLALADSPADDLAMDDVGAGLELAMDDLNAGIDLDEKETDSLANEPADSLAIDNLDDGLTGVIPEGLEENAEEASVSLDDDLEAFADDLSIGEEEISLPDAPAAKFAKADAGEDIDIPANFKSELKSVLSYMDHLLESLPEDKIEEFAKSEYFDSYKKIFKELGLV